MHFLGKKSRARRKKFQDAHVPALRARVCEFLFVVLRTSGYVFVLQVGFLAIISSTCNTYRLKGCTVLLTAVGVRLDTKK